MIGAEFCMMNKKAQGSHMPRFAAIIITDFIYIFVKSHDHAPFC